MEGENLYQCQTIRIKTIYLNSKAIVKQWKPHK